MRILFVDDEPFELRLAEEWALRNNVEIIAISDPLEALELPLHEFNVIVIDQRMPKVTGYELAKMVADKTKASIYIASQYDIATLLLEIRRSGMRPITDVLSKDSLFKDLEVIIHQYEHIK